MDRRVRCLFHLTFFCLMVLGIPDCYPGKITGGLRSEEGVCCQLNQFRTICSHAGDSGPGSVRVNFTFDEADLGASALGLPATTSPSSPFSTSINVNQTGPLGQHIVFTPSEGTKVTVFFYLRSNAGNDIVKMESAVSRSGARGWGNGQDGVCATTQIVGNVGSQVSFDVDTECVEACRLSYGRPLCSLLLLCSKPIFAVPPQPRAKVVDFFFGIVLRDGSRVFELQRVSWDRQTGGASQFSAVNNNECDADGGAVKGYMYNGVVQVVGNPGTMQYELQVMNFQWTDAQGFGKLPAFFVTKKTKR